MTERVKDGGRAFPGFEAGSQGFADIPTKPDKHHSGMSLRDWFAGQAMQCKFGKTDTSMELDDAAEAAYAYADAMLRAREKGNDHD